MRKVPSISGYSGDCFLRESSAVEYGENIRFDKTDDRKFNNNKEKVRSIPH